MRKAFLLAGLILSCTSPAAAQTGLIVSGPPVTSSELRPAGPRGDRNFIRLRSRMVDLRERALAFQASDGGTLTAEHRDFIQVRIDAAYRQYRAAEHIARPSLD